MIKQKLMVIIPTMAIGGTERVILTLLNHFDRNLFHIRIVVVTDNKGDFYELLPNDIIITTLRYKRVRYSIFGILSCVRLYKPDVVLSTLGYLNLIIGFIRPALPRECLFIAREANTVSKALLHNYHAKIYKYLYQRLYGKFDWIVAQTHEMKNDLVINYNVKSNRCVVINNPIDKKNIQMLSQHYTSVKWYRGGENETVKIVAVGRLVAAKGYDLLIRAIALIRDLSLSVVIVGSGQELQYLLELAKSLNVSKCVQFVGSTNNPYPIIAKADLMVLSSRYEGLPNVILEAFACETPVVATPASGVREVLYGIKSCIIAKDISEYALADAIREWYYDRRTNKIDATLTNRYDVTKIVLEYQKLFESTK